MQCAFTAPYHESLKPREALKPRCASLGPVPVAALTVMQIFLYPNRRNALSDRIGKVEKDYWRFLNTAGAVEHPLFLVTIYIFFKFPFFPF